MTVKEAASRAREKDEMVALLDCVRTFSRRQGSRS
jgi:hypothetical protein